MNPQHTFSILTLSSYPTNEDDGTKRLASLLPNVKGFSLPYLSLGYRDRFRLTFERRYGIRTSLKLFLRQNTLPSLTPLRKEIQVAALSADVVFWPLGLKHPQHQLSRLLQPPISCVYYREFPYYFFRDQRLNIRRYVTGLQCLTLDIRSVLERKLELFRICYQEQQFLLSFAVDGHELDSLKHEVAWATGSCASLCRGLHFRSTKTKGG